MTALKNAASAAKAEACRLCGSAEPKPGCPRCELRQPSLFALPMPPPSEEEIAAGDADREAALSDALDRKRRAELLRYWATLERPIRIGLVGCSKTKLSHPHAARHFYTSPLFKAALAYAERTTDDVYILSAFHELVVPDHRLEPYDRPMAEMRKRERMAWGERVVDRLALKLPKIRPQLVILAGRDYQLPVEVAAAVRGWTSVTPLAGRGVGERISWLMRETAALAPTAKKRAYRRGRAS